MRSPGEKSKRERARSIGGSDGGAEAATPHSLVVGKEAGVARSKEAHEGRLLEKGHMRRTARDVIHTEHVHAVPLHRDTYESGAG